MLLADIGNRKLKVISINQRSVVEEMTLAYLARDITVLPENRVAITSLQKEQGQNEILLLNSAGKLSRLGSIPLQRKCYGIVYSQSYMYVVCRDPNSVLVLDMLGKVQTDIPLKSALDQTFKEPEYIAVSKNGQTLYISDWAANLVAGITSKGEVISCYRHSELKEPNGRVVLDDESLCLCCGHPGSIHHISADLKQGRILGMFLMHYTSAITLSASNSL